MNFNIPLLSNVQFGAYPRSHGIVPRDKAMVTENAIREGAFRPIPRQLLRVKRLPKIDASNVMSKDFTTHSSWNLWQKGAVGLIVATGIYMLGKAATQYFSYALLQTDFAGSSGQTSTWPISIRPAQFPDLFSMPVCDPKPERLLPQSEVLLTDLRENERNFPLVLRSSPKEHSATSDAIQVSIEALRDQTSWNLLFQLETQKGELVDPSFPLVLRSSAKEHSATNDAIQVSIEALRGQTSRNLLFQLETQNGEPLDPSFPLVLGSRGEKHKEDILRVVSLYERAASRDFYTSSEVVQVSSGPGKRIVGYLTSCEKGASPPFQGRVLPKAKSLPFSSLQERVGNSLKFKSFLEAQNQLRKFAGASHELGAHRTNDGGDEGDRISQEEIPTFSRLYQQKDQEGNASICLKEVPRNLTAEIVIETRQPFQKIGDIALKVLENVGIFLASVSATWIWRGGRAAASVALEKISKPFIFPNALLPKSPLREPRHQRQNVPPPRTPPFPFSSSSSTIGVIPVPEEIRLTPPVLFVQAEVPAPPLPMPLEALLRNEQPVIEERRLSDALIPPVVPNDARPDHLLNRLKVSPHREERVQARLPGRAEPARRPDVVISMNEKPEDEVWVDIPLDDDDAAIQEEEDPVIERYQQMQARLQERGPHVVIHMPDDGAIIDMTDDPFELTGQPRYSRLTVFVVLLFDQMWGWIARTLRL